MIELQGKGMYIWRVWAIENANISKIVQAAVDASLTHLTVKIADGIYTYNEVYLQELVDKAHRAGLWVLGWQYVYGSNPAYEADRAIRQLNKAPFDGFIVDAETEYKFKPAQATLYMSILRDAFPDLLIALSSYRYPFYHLEFPFNEFLTYCDINMPQVYWMWADGTAAQQLERCVDAFKGSSYVQRPIFPTGAAYKENGWYAKEADVDAFLHAAKIMGLAGCNFWSYYFAKLQLPQLWNRIALFDWEGEGIQPPQPAEPLFVGEVQVSALSIRSGPNVSYPYLGHLVKGERVQVQEIGGEHVWVKHDKGWSAMEVKGTQYIDNVNDDV